MQDYFEIHFEIEHRCLLECKHCSSQSLRQHSIKGYKDNDMIQLLNLLGDYEQYVYLTGGEPLLNENIIQLIDRMNSQSLKIHVGCFTSGIIFEDNGLSSISMQLASELHTIGLKTCYISVYSFDSEIHDFMTGQKSSFFMSQLSIKNLIAAGINTKFNTVIFQKNQYAISYIITHAKQIGATEVRLLKLVKHGNAKDNWAELYISDQQYKSILSQSFNNNKRKSPLITISGYPQMKPCRPFVSSKGCEAGIRLLYVAYSGDIYPCACLKNNSDYKVCHISDIEKIKAYIEKNKNTTYRQFCLSSNGIKE